MPIHKIGKIPQHFPCSRSEISILTANYVNFQREMASKDANKPKKEREYDKENDLADVFITAITPPAPDANFK